MPADVRIKPHARPACDPAAGPLVRIAGSKIKDLREVQSLQRPPSNALKSPHFIPAILTDSDRPVLTSFSGLLAAIFLLTILFPATADARPARWCGWYMRSQVSHDPGVAFNLARNWARWGRPASPGIGVMVVWISHVGKIVGRDSSGNWIIRSGNDGHAVRTRARSVAGAIAFRAE